MTAEGYKAAVEALLAEGKAEGLFPKATVKGPAKAAFDARLAGLIKAGKALGFLRVRPKAQAPTELAIIWGH